MYCIGLRENYYNNILISDVVIVREEKGKGKKSACLRYLALNTRERGTVTRRTASVRVAVRILMSLLRVDRLRAARWRKIYGILFLYLSCSLFVF